MTRSGKDCWSLAELAEETGLSPRTIRYYISRGLVEGPAVAGRGAVYHSSHVEKLRHVRRLQEQGLMLSEISRTLAGEGNAQSALPSPDRWDRYVMDDDVTVWVRGGLAPWRGKQIQRALSEFCTKIKRERQNGDNDGQ